MALLRIQKIVKPRLLTMGMWVCADQSSDSEPSWFDLTLELYDWNSSKCEFLSNVLLSLPACACTLHLVNFRQSVWFRPEGKGRATEYEEVSLNIPVKLDPEFLSPQLTPANKATIIIGMCEGLLHLHSKDIVHQDLKPENIMVSGCLPLLSVY